MNKLLITALIFGMTSAASAQMHRFSRNQSSTQQSNLSTNQSSRQQRSNRTAQNSVTNGTGSIGGMNFQNFLNQQGGQAQQPQAQQPAGGFKLPDLSGLMSQIPDLSQLLGGQGGLGGLQIPGQGNVSGGQNATSSSSASTTVNGADMQGQLPDLSSLFGGGQLPDISSLIGQAGGGAQIPDLSQLLGGLGGQGGQGGFQIPDIGSLMGGGQIPDISKLFSNFQLPDLSQFTGAQLPDLSQMQQGQMPDLSQYTQNFEQSATCAEDAASKFEASATDIESCIDALQLDSQTQPDQAGLQACLAKAQDIVGKNSDLLKCFGQ